MISPVSWVVVLGIAGTLLSSLGAVLGSIKLRREAKRQIHIIPSDEAIAPPSEVQINLFRTY